MFLYKERGGIDGWADYAMSLTDATEDVRVLGHSWR